MFFIVKQSFVPILGLESLQNFKCKTFQTIMCKEYGKNCPSSEKAITASETLTEYRLNSGTTIASRICRL